ncbi:tryptophan synthase subunit alpha [Desulfococcaceae bacterium HSG9]|nr:tryptophan synthase subunit alpha [Desulfococcaceae bacterium HSG9]
MNRLSKAFKNAAEKKEKALVGFVTAGDPTLDESKKIIKKMCESGVDILELGVPFSDPTADGPVIQRSSERALKNKITLETVLKITAELRQDIEVPIILFSYYNPIFAFGPQKFYEKARAAGADGVLVVDLPPEESDELTGGWNDGDFSLIRLVAPTTPSERIAKIAASASGFLYLVSMTGVTGSGGLNTSLIADLVREVRIYSDLPLCVGFGISTVDDVANVAQVADGVVIGSAFERLIEENIDKPDLAERLAERTEEYKEATKI